MANASSPHRQPCRACHQPSQGQQTSAITSLSSLERSARQGCQSCEVFYKGLSLFAEDAYGDNDRVRLDLNQSSTASGIDAFLFSSRRSITVFTDHSTPWLRSEIPDLPLGQLFVPRTTSSPETLSWLAERLADCIENHNLCSKSAVQVRGDRPTLPRRLLEIGTMVEPVVRLVDNGGAALSSAGTGTDAASERNDAPVYACLSHCWGGALPIRTTTDTVDDYHVKIPRNRLPLTFAEAIDIIRRLGISYLWIDSLCIVQDDEDEWRTESSNMAAIYRNARLVVSASKAANSHEGLYAEVGPEFGAQVITIEHGAELGSSRICFRPSLAHMPGFVDGRLFSDPAFPTLRRAWIMQERLLSSRIVHFGPHEIAWECAQHSTCQCRDEATATRHEEAMKLPGALLHKSRPKLFFHEGYWSHIGRGVAFKCWHRLVEDYSALSLTCSKDALPALSGMATLFHHCSDLTYTWGNWEEVLLENLLWYAETASTEQVTDIQWSHRPEWRAPSWSWVSTACRVHFLDSYDAFLPFCTFEVEDKTLGIHAHCVRGQMAQSKFTGGARHAWRVFDVDVFKNLVSNTWADYDLAEPGSGQLLPGDPILCVILGETQPSGSLILMILRAHQELAGERIGLMQIPKTPSQEIGYTGWQSFFSSRGIPLTPRIHMRVE